MSPSPFSAQQRRVLEDDRTTFIGTDARGRPVVEAMVGIPNQLRRWALKRDGDQTDPSEPVYADLRQYPPERAQAGSYCGEARTGWPDEACARPARWLVLGHHAGATIARPVCAEHLGKIWNAQGRPA